MIAIPDIVALLIALLAVLLIAGWYLFGKAIAHIFPSSIGVGPASIHPRAWVEDGVNALGAALKWLIGDVVRPLIHFLLAPVLKFYHWESHLAATIGEAVAWIGWAAHHGIPELAHRLEHLIARAVATAEAYAARRAEAALSTAEHALSTARANLWDGIHHLGADLRGLIHDARAYAAGLVSVAVSELHTLIHDARAYAYQLAHAVRADLLKALGAEEAARKAAIHDTVSLVKSTAAVTLGAAEAYTEQAIATVGAGILVTDLPGVTGLVDGLADDVTSLAGVLGTDLPQLGDLLGELDLSVPLDIVGALTGGLVLERVLARYLRDCGVPNCRNLSGLGRFLEDLLAGAGLAALLAMLVEMVTDPETAARNTVSDLSGVLDGATGFARDLLGVG